MVVGGSQQQTLDPGFVLIGTSRQDVPVILREMVLPDGFDFVSPSLTVKDVTIELSGPRPTSCRTACQVARNPCPWIPVDYLQPPYLLTPVTPREGT
ncbi:unnamed protein product [Schistosoma curassoni]|uniref:MacB_PCD domain-containing protein n=1 Tax=Schistosoma curassoni TaxID=6186 RepID=A0A183JZL0_9TREM|nr:unnamed protein product [Schistosoma curassoni]